MTLRLLFALSFVSIIAPNLHADNTKPKRVQTTNPFLIPMRDSKAPIALVKKVRSGKVLRSGITPLLGSKRQQCWYLWTATPDKNGETSNPQFSVWQTTGKNRWAKLGNWSVSTDDEPKEAQFFWLNSKTRIGWVLKVGNSLTVWPQGAKTKPVAIYKDEFGMSASSISALYYDFNVEKDKRGFYTITKIYSEPGMNDKGETITINERKVCLWDGKQWVEQ